MDRSVIQKNDEVTDRVAFDKQVLQDFDELLAVLAKKRDALTGWALTIEPLTVLARKYSCRSAVTTIFPMRKFNAR